MKQRNISSLFSGVLNKGLNLLNLSLLLSAAAINLNSQTNYSFAPCGAVGQFGPSQGMATTAYLPTNLADNVTVLGNGYQQLTVPIPGIIINPVLSKRGL